MDASNLLPLDPAGDLVDQIEGYADAHEMERGYRFSAAVLNPSTIREVSRALSGNARYVGAGASACLMTRTLKILRDPWTPPMMVWFRNEERLQDPEECPTCGGPFATKSQSSD